MRKNSNTYVTIVTILILNALLSTHYVSQKMVKRWSKRSQENDLIKMNDHRDHLMTIFLSLKNIDSQRVIKLMVKKVRMVTGYNK